MIDSDTQTVTARIPTDLSEWITTEFGHGFKQAFIEQCFMSLRHLMIEGEIPPPTEYARLASIHAVTEIARR